MIDHGRISAIGPTARVERLRAELIASKPILCSERALLVTESYRQAESEPAPIRRAKALAHILENMTQNIYDGELIVGSHGSNGRRSAPVFPEYAIDWLMEELDETLETRPQDTFVVPAQVKADLHAVAPYWRGRTVHEKYRALLPGDARRARDAYLFTRDLFERSGYGHTCYQMEKLLKAGIRGLREEVKGKLAGLCPLTAEDMERRLFYEGLLICFDAVTAYARRYADKATSLAETEADPKRRAELGKIASVCRGVPENPAMDIWEAMQAVAFMQLIIQTETSGDSVSPGRMDQYLYPFYQKDRADGTYADEQIQELLDCLWIKFNEIIKVQDSESIRIHPGFPMTPNVAAGGQTADGKDAVNELSFMMLNAQSHIRLTCPQFTARFFEGTPEAFKLRAAEVISLGTGMPALFGDKGCIAAIERTLPELPAENARDFSIVGCVELAPKGFQGRVNGGLLNVARVVDLAINRGIDRLTGERLGVDTGIPNTYAELMGAVARQMERIVSLQVQNALAVDMAQRENTPHLLLSSLIDGCIESGRDMTAGGSRYGATPILYAGLATAADSICAIKKCVFDEKAFSLKEVNRALDADFAGFADIRKKLLAAPKYGAGDPYADAVMRELTDLFFGIVERRRDIDNRPYTSMVLTLGGTVPHGWKTGATADGRKAKTPVSDSMSPSNLARGTSPTGTLLSASRIDQTHILEGNVVNLKFSRGVLSSPESRKKFVDLANVYFERLGGQELQVNMADAAMLRDAQAHPENYADLIIRVAGYSARFVELDRELQDDIIARAEYAAV